ncbi:MAG TPA: methanogenesis marker 9 domain-containing protein [Methanothrix sp.]|nr:methanogenesis marker 9 domain-containing protein [Methanothrix sp.]HOK57712.1 methanogenesis marker 9 domain-containing protein [Methanothrix sp.]HOL43115.1 methanogenesis marker 9 domain-containing protein [Methanothrix sp.]HPO88117.1 methanogenesis marker 9 domain-containing protein [Methanothrix sp.]
MLKIGYASLKSPVAMICHGNACPPDVGLAVIEDVEERDDIDALVRDAGVPAVLSFRSASSDRLLEVSRTAARMRAILEIDLSGGDSVDLIRACGLIKLIKSAGAATSLRISPDVVGPKSNPGAIRRLKSAGLDLIHLDLRGCDGSATSVLRSVSDARGPGIMALSEVRSFEDAKRLLSMGADVISLKEPADEEFARWLSSALRKFEDITGWYNAPKHICAGGDLRGLAFCCPPVKPCPVHGALKRLGMTPEEFVRRKLELARGTPLEKGDGTCFGSLIWCCKITKPCYLRDAALRRAGLTPKEYMILKRRVAEGLLR